MPVPPDPEQSASRREERRVSFQVSGFSGPLPPPEALEHYNRILPGAADRLLTMAEGQTRHRQGLENRALHAKVWSERIGQVMAFILSMVALLGSLWLMSNGMWQAGFGVLLTTVIALVVAFIKGRQQQRTELERKAQTFVQR